jgi:hypothetical protein
VKTVALALVLAAASAAQTGTPVIQLEKDAAGRSVFRVTGVQEVSAETAFGGVFLVYAGESSGLPPLLGAYHTESGALLFTPRFPLQPGLRYRAVLKVAGRELTQTFHLLAADRAPTAVVEQVYPTVDVLPENQLKLYLHFSEPMSRGEAWRRIRLLDESGKAVDLPFLEVDEELWDPEGKRLTVFFDPGRIKRGLLPNEEVGTSIEEGRSYTFIVDREWPDAQGRPLRAGFRRTFRAGPPDRDPPDPKTWRLTTPRAGTADPLVLEFPESMDRALLERVVNVTDQRGHAVEGSVEIDRRETRWRFTPGEPWSPGSYSVQAETILEDLAGNTIGRPFEVDVFERVEDRIHRETVSLAFEIGP